MDGLGMRGVVRWRNLRSAIMAGALAGGGLLTMALPASAAETSAAPSTYAVWEGRQEDGASSVLGWV